ncbi:MAG: bacteriocin family protein [Bacteroidales bacterium]|nr:bacteriocin family protein [Bacteroidales bacterium]
MNILKKALAPLTDAAWNEITSEAAKVLDATLTARKFADIDGPNGFDFSAVSTGRLYTPGNQSKTGVNYGIRQVIPLIETRKPFTLDIWELDNVNRGAKDVNLDNMLKAAEEIALFEENFIYKGFKQGETKGLLKSSEHEQVKTPEDPEDFLKAVAAGVIRLRESWVKGPYSMVINDQVWTRLMKLTEGYPLSKQLVKIIGGHIIVNPNIDQSLLISEQGGDYELVLGQDISIGYDSHDSEKVKLYFTESFTFRILSPEAIIVFN